MMHGTHNVTLIKIYITTDLQFNGGHPVVPTEHIKTECLFNCRTQPLIFLLFKRSYMFRSLNGHHHRATNNNLTVK